MAKSRLVGARVLVLGGAGFIGSHLVEELNKFKPEAVVVADNFFLGNMANLSFSPEPTFETETVRIDGTDFAALSHLVQTRRIDIIFNFAVIPLPTSLEFPSWTVTSNILLTTNCCELVRTGLIERLVHVSSSEVYGSASYVPMNELHPFNPSTPYAASKVASDQIVLSYKKTFGIEALIVRPFNNFGPKQNSGSYAGIIPIIISRVLGGIPIEVFGDGEQTRDYVFVRDTASGILDLASLIDWPTEVVNFATGTETSVNTLIEKILQIMRRENHQVVYSEARPGDVKRHAGDPSLLRNLLGKIPESLNASNLRTTVEWYSNVA